jgi:predicted membrane protein DUF2207
MERRFLPAAALGALWVMTVAAAPAARYVRGGSQLTDGVVFNTWTVATSLAILLAGLWAIAWFWWQYGRDVAYLADGEHAPVVVEFEPPQNLRAAQLGLIMREIADTRDITATIVDLAGRGVVSITEVPGQQDWVIAWQPNQATGLLPFERALLDGLFALGRREVRISELRGSFQPAVQSVQGLLYADAMARNLFTMRPDYLRYGRIFGGILIAFIGLWIASSLVPIRFSLVGLTISLLGVIFALTYRFMSVRTTAGRDLLQHTLGFRLYINTAEKYRQQFAEKSDQFTRLLPYAIVFGCADGWAKAFEGIGATKTNADSQPMQAAVLAEALEAMEATIASSMSTRPGASS